MVHLKAQTAAHIPVLGYQKPILDFSLYFTDLPADKDLPHTIHTTK